MSQPDPRAARSREAILVAARELLLKHGPAAITHQRVADQAGVGRATVYRHWARTETLLLDVMAGAGMPFFRDPRSPIRPWLHVHLRLLADDLAQPQVTAVALTLMHGALWDPEVARQRDLFLGTIRERLADALAVASAAGEITDHLAGDEAAALLAGSLLYRIAMQNGAVSREFLTRLIDAVGTWR